jgi:hypothetical protein
MNLADSEQHEPTKNTDREAHANAGDPNPHIPITLGVTSSPPPDAHGQVTCNAEKDPWDKFKKFHSYDNH